MSVVVLIRRTAWARTGDMSTTSYLPANICRWWWLCLWRGCRLSQRFAHQRRVCRCLWHSAAASVQLSLSVRLQSVRL